MAESKKKTVSKSDVSPVSEDNKLVLPTSKIWITLEEVTYGNTTMLSQVMKLGEGVLMKSLTITSNYSSESITYIPEVVLVQNRKTGEYKISTVAEHRGENFDFDIV